MFLLYSVDLHIHQFQALDFLYFILLLNGNKMLHQTNIRMNV